MSTGVVSTTETLFRAFASAVFGFFGPSSSSTATASASALALGLAVFVEFRFFGSLIRGLVGINHLFLICGGFFREEERTHRGDEIARYRGHVVLEFHFGQSFRDRGQNLLARNAEVLGHGVDSNRKCRLGGGFGH